MKSRSEAQHGFFSATAKLSQALEFNLKIKMNKEHTIFSFIGPEDQVKIKVRVALQEILPATIHYKRKTYFEAMTQHHGRHYDIYVPHRDSETLVKMLWYLGKIRGRFFEPAYLEKEFRNSGIMLEKRSHTAAKNLAKAAKEALAKKHEPLLSKNQKPEDKAFWTDKELAEEANQNRWCWIL